MITMQFLIEIFKLKIVTSTCFERSQRFSWHSSFFCCYKQMITEMWESYINDTCFVSTMYNAIQCSAYSRCWRFFYDFNPFRMLFALSDFIKHIHYNSLSQTCTDLIISAMFFVRETRFKRRFFFELCET